MVKAKPFFNRITAILLALLMLIPTMTVFEASGTSLSVGTAVGKPGDQVSVNIALSGNSGIAYLKLKIGYDATQLTLKGAQNAGVLTGTFTTSKTPDINPYVLQWMGAENSSGNGVVATLSFQIASTASAGDKAISVSVVECYNENYDDVTLSASNGKITVNTTSPKVLSSISVSKQPTKTTYFVGESLDTAGLQLKLTYDDGSTSYVTSGFTTSGFSSTSAGTKTVTVSYSGKTTTFSVTVKNKSLTTISVSKQPTKTTYFVGESLDTTGLQLKLTYDDGSTSYVSSGFTTSGFSSASAGTKTVTATYSGKTTTFTVSVQTKPTTAIISANSVSANPGDQVSVNISLSGNPGIAYLKLKIGYDATQLTLIGAEKTGVLSGYFTTSKTPEVNPYVIQWMGAENSSGNGVVATLSFQIASTASAGDKAISVSVEECYNEDYDGVTLSATNGIVTVNASLPKVLSSISVSGTPTKTTYYIGESLDTTGLQLKLTYSDGSTSYVTSGFTTSGFNSTSVGTKTVIVTYSGKTTTFNVIVEDNTYSIIIHPSVDFLTLDLNGKKSTIVTFTVTGNYPSNAIFGCGHNLYDIKVTNISSNHYEYTYLIEALDVGHTYFSFDIGNSSDEYYKEVRIPIRVIDSSLEVTSVNVNVFPIKTTYSLGDSLDTTGMQVRLSYNDGSTEYILDNYESYGLAFSGFDSDSVGTKTVTVNYSGKTTTFTVTVKQNGCILMGDIDGDGKISTEDAMMVNSYLNNKIELTIPQILAADVLHDLQLNALDALAISKYANNGQINGLVDQTISLSEIFGDANNDGRIDINDATYIQMYLAEYHEFSELQLIIADLNGDGSVNIQDITVLQRFLAESIQYFPVLDYV